MKQLSLEKLNTPLPVDANGELDKAFSNCAKNPVLKTWLLTSLDLPCTQPISRERLKHFAKIESVLKADTLLIQDKDFEFFKKFLEEEIKLQHRQLFTMIVDFLDATKDVADEKIVSKPTED